MQNHTYMYNCIQRNDILDILGIVIPIFNVLLVVIYFVEYLVK